MDHVVPQTRAYGAPVVRRVVSSTLATDWFDYELEESADWMPNGALWIVGVEGPDQTMSDAIDLPGGMDIDDPEPVDGIFALFDANEGTVIGTGALRDEGPFTLQGLRGLRETSLAIVHPTAEPSETPPTPSPGPATFALARAERLARRTAPSRSAPTLPLTMTMVGRDGVAPMLRFLPAVEILDFWILSEDVYRLQERRVKPGQGSTQSTRIVSGPLEALLRFEGEGADEPDRVELRESRATYPRLLRAPASPLARAIRPEPPFLPAEPIAQGIASGALRETGRGRVAGVETRVLRDADGAAIDVVPGLGLKLRLADTDQGGTGFVPGTTYETYDLQELDRFPEGWFDVEAYRDDADELHSLRPLARPGPDAPREALGALSWSAGPITSGARIEAGVLATRRLRVEEGDQRKDAVDGFEQSWWSAHDITRDGEPVAIVLQGDRSLDDLDHSLAPYHDVLGPDAPLEGAYSSGPTPWHLTDQITTTLPSGARAWIGWHDPETYDCGDWYPEPISTSYCVPGEYRFAASWRPPTGIRVAVLGTEAIASSEAFVEMIKALDRQARRPGSAVGSE